MSRPGHPRSEFQRTKSPPILRSPTTERQCVLHVLDPRVNRVVNVRASRAVPTMAPFVTGSTLCRDYLDRSGCAKGAHCTYVHIAGKENLWEPIAPSVAPNGRYLAGFVVKCYDIHHGKYLSLPSETVLPTAGSGNYISLFNENGENFKARFQVCAKYLRSQWCDSASSCPEIHTDLTDFTGVTANETHVCDEEALRCYERLPFDVTVRVYQQNSVDDFSDFPGDEVLLTQGSQTYLDCFLADGRQIPRKKMQHCAHFRLKRLCRVGPACKFIHVVSDALLSPTDTEIAEMVSSQSSIPSRQEARSPLSGRDTPVGGVSEVNVVIRERSRGSEYRSPLSIDQIDEQPDLGTSAAKTRTMGPADIAAMLASRMSSNTGGCGNSNSNAAVAPQSLSGPAASVAHVSTRAPAPLQVIPVDRPATTSPIHTHNPYQPLSANRSPTILSNSSFGSQQSASGQPVHPYTGSAQSMTVVPPAASAARVAQPIAVPVFPPGTVEYHSPPAQHHHVHQHHQHQQHQQQHYHPQYVTSVALPPPQPQHLAPLTQPTYASVYPQGSHNSIPVYSQFQQHHHQHVHQQQPAPAQQQQYLPQQQQYFPSAPVHGVPPPPQGHPWPQPAPAQQQSSPYCR